MSISKVFNKSRTKPSLAPDGLTDNEASGITNGGKRSGLMGDLMYQARGGHLGPNAKTVLQGLKTMSHGGPMNDRELLLEHGVSLLQSLPSNSDTGAKVAGDLIGMLWHDLPHPPGSIVGPQGVYRTGDGSGNNPFNPDLGKAGSPYARNVPATRPKPPNLPDPELVFDMLLRRDAFRPHPQGLSSFFFAFATCVIHECFQTSQENWWINETSSYVDLSTVYGNTQEEQNKVRTFDGYGTLFPDTIASARIMLMPPAVVAVLILFSRQHNHIAARLLQINEKGLYSQDVASLDPAAKKKQDEDIFQISRNITAAFFAKVVLGDYVAAILATVKANSEWTLDLGGEIKHNDLSRLERGGGGAVSCEFNVLYHWHASMSAKDAAWTEAVFKSVYPDKAMADLTPREFYTVAGRHAHQLGVTHPKDWVIHGLKRGPDGKYPDAQLAELIKDAIDEPAAAFGAHGTPEQLKVVEVLGMKMARDRFGVCTMNEFRKYMNLTPFTSFQEWNPDEKTWRAAEQLYGHVDDLELYPGLQAEETKPAMPGSGVCVGHTTGRAILDDAVSLIRCDRFFTHDLNTSTLTSWGVSQLKAQPGAMGGIFSTLLFTNLPNSFTFNSTYALFPFYTPASIDDTLRKNGTLKSYDVTRGPSNGAIKTVSSFKACKDMLNDRDIFNTHYNSMIKQVSGGRGFMIGFDDHHRHDPPQKMMSDAFYYPDFDQLVSAFFASRIDYQIKKASLAFTGTTDRMLDIVRDVTNVVPVLWAAHQFALPLKTEQTPRGLYSVPELRTMIMEVFNFTTFGILPKHGFRLRDAATKAAESLRNVMVARLKTSTGIKDKLQDLASAGTSYEDSLESEHMYSTLFKTGQHVEELATTCLGVLTPIVGNLTHQLSLLVNLYLQDQYTDERERIAELSRQDTPAADKELLGYIREGMRISGVIVGLPRIVAKDTIINDGGEKVELVAGNIVLIGISQAHMDPAQFPNPAKIDPTRPKSDYILLGDGMHHCFGERLAWTSLLTSMKSIFKLKNLRRATGKAGQFVKISDQVGSLVAPMYLNSSCSESPAPSSLQVMYDADTVDAPVGEAAVKNIKLLVRERKDARAKGATSALAQEQSPVESGDNQNGGTPIDSANGVNGVPKHKPSFIKRMSVRGRSTH